jgi:hypothetical protein
MWPMAAGSRKQSIASGQESASNTPPGTPAAPSILQTISSNVVSAATALTPYKRVFTPSHKSSLGSQTFYFT